MPKMSERRGRRLQQERAARGPSSRLRPQKVGYTEAYRRWRLARAGGIVLIAVGIVMAVVHIGAHLGDFTLLPLQDLLIGWPMAGVLVIFGLVLAGRRPRH